MKLALLLLLAQVQPVVPVDPLRPSASPWSREPDGGIRLKVDTGSSSAGSSSSAGGVVDGGSINAHQAGPWVVSTYWDGGSAGAYSGPFGGVVDGGSITAHQGGAWSVGQAGSWVVTTYSDGGASPVTVTNASLAVTGPLTDAQLRAAVVPISGVVTTYWDGGVSTGLTDTQLRATPVQVDLSTRPVFVYWDGGAGAAGLTDGQLRATPVPVSGVVTTYWDGGAPAAALTDTQLRATPVPVSVAGLVAWDDGGFARTIVYEDGGARLISGVVTTYWDGGATPTNLGTNSVFVYWDGGSPGFGTANGTVPTQSMLQSGRAVAYGSSPTAVTAGNNAPQVSDLEGMPYVNTGHPRAVFCQMASAATATLIELTGCAAVASTSYYVKSVVFSGGIATAATVPALLRSGTGANCATATATWATCWHGTAGSCVYYFDPPIKITAAHALCAIDATVGTKSVMLTGYLAP